MVIWRAATCKLPSHVQRIKHSRKPHLSLSLSSDHHLSLTSSGHLISSYFLSLHYIHQVPCYCIPQCECFWHIQLKFIKKKLLTWDRKKKVHLLNVHLIFVLMTFHLLFVWPPLIFLMQKQKKIKTFQFEKSERF